MHGSCSNGAPGIWARATRVFIEGVVAFGLGGFIYVGIFPLGLIGDLGIPSGTGPLSIPAHPLTSGAVTFSARKGANGTIRRCQIEWSWNCGIGIDAGHFV